MSLQSSIIVEVKKNEKTYTFHMPYGVPLQDCYDASLEVTKEIVEFSKRMDEQKKAQEEVPAADHVDEPKVSD